MSVSSISVVSDSDKSVALVSKQLPGSQAVGKLSLFGLMATVVAASRISDEERGDVSRFISAKAQAHLGSGEPARFGCEVAMSMLQLLSGLHAMPENWLRMEGFRTSVKNGVASLAIAGGKMHKERGVMPASFWHMNPCRESFCIGGVLTSMYSPIVLHDKMYGLDESRNGSSVKHTGYVTSFSVKTTIRSVDPRVLCDVRSEEFVNLSRWLAVATYAVPSSDAGMRWLMTPMSCADAKASGCKFVQFKTCMFYNELQTIVVMLCSEKNLNWKYVMSRFAVLSVGFADIINLHYTGKLYYSEVVSVRVALSHIDNAAVEDFIHFFALPEIRGVSFATVKLGDPKHTIENFVPLPTYSWGGKRHEASVFGAVCVTDVELLFEELGHGHTYADASNLLGEAGYCGSWKKVEYEHADALIISSTDLLLGKYPAQGRVTIGVTGRNVRYLPCGIDQAWSLEIGSTNWKAVWTATSSVGRGSALVVSGVSHDTARMFGASLGVVETMSDDFVSRDYGILSSRRSMVQSILSPCVLTKVVGNVGKRSAVAICEVLTPDGYLDKKIRKNVRSDFSLPALDKVREYFALSFHEKCPSEKQSFACEVSPLYDAMQTNMLQDFASISIAPVDKGVLAQRADCRQVGSREFEPTKISPEFQERIDAWRQDIIMTSAICAPDKPVLSAVVGLDVIAEVAESANVSNERAAQVLGKVNGVLEHALQHFENQEFVHGDVGYRAPVFIPSSGAARVDEMEGIIGDFVHEFGVSHQLVTRYYIDNECDVRKTHIALQEYRDQAVQVFPYPYGNSE